VIHNYGFQLALAFDNEYGVADNWPASAEHLTPYFSIIFGILGPEEGEQFLAAARRACRRRTELQQKTPPELRPLAGDFTRCLDRELGEQEETLGRLTAWEAMRAIQQLAQRDPAASLEDFLDCALEACRRSSGQFRGELAAAAAGA
jgi:hypothetical protein